MVELQIPLYNGRINMYPLRDCLQVSLDEDYDTILLYFYTDSPIHDYDYFVSKRIKEYYKEGESPLFIRVELWVYQEGCYVKKGMREELLRRKWAEAVRDRLSFIPRTKIHAKCKEVIDHYAVRGYYNLGDGARWCRGFTREGDI